MDTELSFRNLLAEITQSLFAAIPDLLAALSIILLGWMLATFIRRISVKAMNRFGTEEFAERAGIETFLLKGGVRYTTTTILSQIIYWIFLLLAVVIALRVAGFSDVTLAINELLAFIPRLLFAFAILLFGLVFARFMRIALLAWLNNLQVQGANAIAQVAHLTLIALVVSVALEQLRIGGQVIITSFLLAFGALCLGVGIAFGLAGKTHARHILDRLFRSRS